ncbi:MAG: GNAT family N-acetyltransferase [Ilumatobacteraceae bacterium]|nr:GNAT family N-acetyltransferase [Acidimicrobiales bacterium]MCB9395628.1 GNAT family N-acetyltransferase [Acidimicrobiaceae bacterium]
MRTWTVRPVRVDEYEPWARLFRGYAEFYGRHLSDEQAREIWGWIHDTAVIEAYVAVELDAAGTEIGEPMGLAHLREWVRPLRATVNGYLDDLFVDPSVRGAGAVEAVFAFLRHLAVARGWPVVRWTTADDNYRARSIYDRAATRTTWITYDMDVAPPN